MYFMKTIAIIASISGLFLALSLAESAFSENHVEIPQTSRDCASSDSCFVPTILSIKKGQTAIWQNNDLTIHSIVSGSKDSGKSGAISSGTIYPGESFSFTVTSSGMFPYYCEIHPWMKGVIWAT